MDPQVQPMVEAVERSPADALRIQVAAVAAQQIALDEEEQRLADRRAAWQEHEERSALHWEEKRRELEWLYERVQAERAAVVEERKDCERHIERLTGDLSQAQRDILEAEKHVQAERRALSGMQQKLKKRWHRHWKLKQQQYLERQSAQAALAQTLAQREHALAAAEAAFNDERRRFNGEAAMTRIALQERWGELRRAQFRWRHRRGLERAALRVRTCQIEAAARQVAQARLQLDCDRHAWLTQRQALEAELDGVNTRVQNQRQLMNEQEARLYWLEEQVYLRELSQTSATAAQATEPAEVGAADSNPGAAADPQRTDHTGSLVRAGHDGIPTTQVREQEAAQPGRSTAHLRAPMTAALVATARNERFGTAAPLTAAGAQRVADLNQLADDLEDQRRQLVEAWQRIAALHDRWQADRDVVVAGLEAQGRQLLERERAVEARARESLAVDEALRQRHDELLHLHNQIVAWRSQLNLAQNTWENDRTQSLIELSEKDATAEQHLAALIDLRARWAKRRKKELEILQSERAAADQMRKEFAKLRQELVQRSAALDEEKRILAEKALALEHYRAQVLGRSTTDNRQAERRLERLRRRWLTHNAEVIRKAGRERTALRVELAELEQRHEVLSRQAAEIAAAEAELTDQRTAWEQERVQAERRQAGLAPELRRAEQQRNFAEQQLTALRDEIEHIARALLEQPDLPRLSFDQAA